MWWERLISSYGLLWFFFQKKITDELKEKGDIPGKPEDLVKFIKKHFEGKLTPVEWDEIDVDTGIFQLKQGCMCIVLELGMSEKICVKDAAFKTEIWGHVYINYYLLKW